MPPDRIALSSAESHAPAASRRWSAGSCEGDSAARRRPAPTPALAHPGQKPSVRAKARRAAPHSKRKMLTRVARRAQEWASRIAAQNRGRTELPCRCGKAARTRLFLDIV
eukprot:scaffold941_cov97-Isochrysis_galbana.AAC.2